MADTNQNQKQRSAWQQFIDGFKPVADRADLDLEESRQKYGDQLQTDLALTPMERRLKIQKGFEGSK